MKRKDKIPRPIEPSPLDPQGSYTGVPMDPRERPVQDADDLKEITMQRARGSATRPDFIVISPLPPQ